MKKYLIFTVFMASAIATLICFQSQLPIFEDEMADEIIVQTQKESSNPIVETITIEPSTHAQQKNQQKPHFTETMQSKQEKPIVESEKNIMQSTLGIIKPDAVEAGFSGKIIELIELNRFEIVNMQKKTLTRSEAEKFYVIHKDRPFFKELVTFMTSGPVIILELKKLNAVRDWRYLMGATNPERAYLGTLRAMFGLDITHNAVHGSDSAENAEQEIAFFFPKNVGKNPETYLPVIVPEEIETGE